VSLRGEQTLLLRGVRNLRVPDETEFNATLRFTCPNGLGDVWYYEVFMDVENRPNEGGEYLAFAIPKSHAVQ
jgi:hypothetical protein